MEIEFPIEGADFVRPVVHQEPSRVGHQCSGSKTVRTSEGPGKKKKSNDGRRVLWGVGLVGLVCMILAIVITIGCVWSDSQLAWSMSDIGGTVYRALIVLAYLCMVVGVAVLVVLTPVEAGLAAKQKGHTGVRFHIVVLTAGALLFGVASILLGYTAVCLAMGTLETPNETACIALSIQMVVGICLWGVGYTIRPNRSNKGSEETGHTTKGTLEK